ncbi:MAG: SDR family oxidoreductase [Deltaproteobacteria bacterium]|jgi:UDP-glucose 4-epimerase|nr:SDR family oxidoreductase [Deltaproteobacteria bacterium]
MKLPFKSALVTGGAGFIGSHLVEALVDAGCRVRVYDNLSSGDAANLEHLEGQFSLYEADIRDREKLEAALDGCELVFHLAAIVSVPRTVEDPIGSADVNETGSLIVLDASRRAGVKRVVFSSSCAVYGDDPRLPKRENMAPKPLSPYAVQKLAAEYHAKAFYDLYGLETTALRYFNVYGPRQDPSSPYSGVISIFMTKALMEEPAVIYGDGNQSRDFIFVRDVVKANLLAASAKNANGQVINIGSGRPVRINDLWQAIGALSGRSRDPQYAGKRPGDIVASLAGMQKAKALLGFDCEVSFEKGLETTFEWYRSRRSEVR